MLSFVKEWIKLAGQLNGSSLAGGDLGHRQKGPVQLIWVKAGKLVSGDPVEAVELMVSAAGWVSMN